MSQATESKIIILAYLALFVLGFSTGAIKAFLDRSKCGNRSILLSQSSSPPSSPFPGRGRQDDR